MSSYPFAIEFMAELAHGGVRHVCVSPGSRSTPLAIAAGREPGLRVSTHVDERSAGFFALGLARASRSPVALVCTSGTAAANLLPAVVEAHHARVPLIVLTADRPAELRDWGAGQTIDQLRLFGTAAHWFAELSPPEQHDDALRYAQSLAARAAAESRGHGVRAAGPVHLNWPLREPLEPRSAEDLAPARRLRRGLLVSRPESQVAPEALDALAEIASVHEKGWIACGPADLTPAEVEAVAGLSRATGWPIVADAASQLRRGAHVASTPVLAAADLWLRDAAVAKAVAPDVVVRLGPTPVSKAHRLALEANPPRHLIVNDADGSWQDPSHLATQVVVADLESFCRAWAGRCHARRADSGWLDRLQRMDRAATIEVGRVLDEDAPRLCEPRAVRALCESLPDGSILYVSNSMPIRDVDALLSLGPSRVRLLANRGANGIDGVTSSAIGAAAADGRVVLLTGDLAFLHDLGGLLAATRHALDVTVVVIDNDGGGIFSFLPVAEAIDPAGFESLFRVPHGLDLAAAAPLFGAGFERATSEEALRKALDMAHAASGLSIIQVPVNAAESRASLRSVVAAATAAAREALGA